MSENTVQCPRWIQQALELAMNFVVENETRLVPGNHKSQFDGVTVTMVIPDRPYGSILVLAH